MKRQRGLICLALALFVALGFTPTARAASPEIIWFPEGYTLKGESYYIPELNWLRMGNYGGDPCVVDLSTGRIVERFKDIKPFTEGLAAVCQVNTEYGWDEWGYIDETGQIVIPMEYDDADPFSDGLAAVFNRMGWSLGGWDAGWRFIDKTGTVVIPHIYDDMYGTFSEGLLAVSRDEKFGYIDQTGQLVIPLEYDGASDFSYGVASVKKDGKWGCINKNGQIVVPFEYDYAEPVSSTLTAVAICGGNSNDVFDDGRWGIVDHTTGQMVLPMEYWCIFDASDGMVKVSKDLTNSSFINEQGKLFPTFYGKTENFTEGLAGVSFSALAAFGLGPENDAGYIDKTGQMVIPAEYEDTREFHEGLAAVRKNGKWGYIDRTGQMVIKPEYDSAMEFCGGVAAVEKNGNWGYISNTGQVIIPLSYDFGGYWPTYINESKGVKSNRCFPIVQGERYGVFLNPYWVPPIPATGITYPSTQTVDVDGAPTNFQMYALKDANGNLTNYIKLRDIASLLNGTAVQFDVSWDGAVNILSGHAYTPNGSEMTTPFSGDRAYTFATAPTKVNGKEIAMDAIVLKDDQGGAYTYYKLRDLGEALGFTVDWSAQRGIYIETR